ncbi:hypothetical protein [Sinanaerobacter sp. ZZT-01]|uniref:hypothetical protein n=1 Tax=Sinanaerobacter sp. ZZT-01 TaxID=3111540 RepID=UPI002D79ED47|nr:hypothetical protein [Sinanaerobacter sp. ZZT-01]WRR92088.1 hypothetical protein U5921_08370 [Sinanaerobacter sp. ZZT-01]
MNKSFRFQSEKIQGRLRRLNWFWSISVIIFILLSFSDNLATDRPSELSFVLKEYNPLLACLCVPFVICLVVKLIEFFLIRFKSAAIVPDKKSILSWLIRHFYISYKTEQLVLKEETILLILQTAFCVFGFFMEMKWYLIGAIGMLLYLLLYITLSFEDIKNLLKN